MPLPQGSFVRMRGLPPTVALSEGHSIAPGSWAVPLAALPNLKITLPAGLTGRSEISVTLVGIDGTVLAEAKSMLVVAAASARRTAERKARATRHPPRSCEPAPRCRLPPEQPERVPASIPPDGSRN